MCPVRLTIVPIALRSLLLLSVTCASAFAAEALSSADAVSILRQAQARDAAPGSYHLETTRKRKTTTTTTTTLMRRPVQGKTLSRIETMTVTDAHPERKRTSITVVNADGRWRIVGNTAVLMPPAIDLGRFADLMNRSAGGEKTSIADSTGQDAERAKKAIGFGSHVKISGERVAEAGRELVRVTRSYDEETRKFFAELADEQLAEFKKQLSFGKRIAMSAIMAAKGGVETMIPASEVFTVDVAANKVLKIETYGPNGKLLSTRGEAKDPEKIADLTDDTFALPAGVEIVRPKSFAEAAELTEKLEAQEKKNAPDEG